MTEAAGRTDAVSPVRIALHTWTIEPSDTQLECHLATLSPDEHARATAFVYAEDRRAFIAARGGLRALLAQTTGREAAGLAFDYGDSGRPTLRRDDNRAVPFFNLSHSGSLAIAAISWQCQPGIDIERVRPIEPEVAIHHFSTAELSVLSALEGDEWLAGFYRCWTRKEAYVKALGVGVGIDLTAFDVSLAVDEPAAILRIGSATSAHRAWQMLDLALPPGYIGAVTAKTDGRPLRLE